MPAKGEPAGTRESPPVGMDVGGTTFVWRDAMIRMGKMTALCAGLAMTAGTALAEDAMVIRGGESLVEVRRVEHHVNRGEGRRKTKVVTIEIEDRIHTVAKARAMWGVTDKDALIHVELVHENVLLDPNKEYIRQNEYAINENDQIPAAHRLAKDLRAGKAEVIFGSPMMVPMTEVSEGRPMMIIERPDGAPKRAIPSVPAPPRKSDKALVAMAK